MEKWDAYTRERKLTDEIRLVCPSMEYDEDIMLLRQEIRVLGRTYRLHCSTIRERAWLCQGDIKT